MARSTSNREADQLDNGAHRDYTTNAPAQETANARVDTIGPFRRANLAISVSAQPLTLGGVDADAPVSAIAHSPGKILGLTYKLLANITAGGATSVQLQATIAPAATPATPAVVGDVMAIASGGTQPQTGVPDESAEFTFAKGDALGVNISTSGTLAPAGSNDIDVYLIVRWAASPAN